MSESSIHFFTGKNTYALEQELLRWKKTFREKHGPENLIDLQASDFSLSSLLDATATMPFIAEKRLVVMKGIPRMDKDAFQSIKDSIHPAVILAFVEPEPDARLTITKELKKVATMHVFEPLNTPELKHWLKAQAQSCGRTLDPSAADHVLLCVGTNQQTLAEELKKLCLFTEETITKEDVDAVAVPSGSQVIWRLTDLLGNGKTDEALEFVRSSVERGQDPYSLWAILLNMIKNLSLVWAALQDGITSDKEIASQAGIHFFAVRSMKSLASSISEESIRSLVQFAHESDIALKSGGYKYTAERPEELMTLLDRTILSCKSG